MKTYKVTYTGTSSRFENFYAELQAENPTKAIYAALNSYIFLTEVEDGVIKDSDNELVLTANYPHLLDYDGGYFEAETI